MEKAHYNYIYQFCIAKLKVLSLLWLANHCQMMSVVSWKLIMKSQNDCYFVLGWWVQCYVLCQQWCCDCWSWWNTQSYEACWCTRDIQHGSVRYTFRKFSGMGNEWCVQSIVKVHFSCGSDIFSRLSQMPLEVVVNILYGDVSVITCNMGWLKIL